MDKLTAERARELLSYDPDSGELRWRVRRGSRAAAGSVAGSLGLQGYLDVRIDKRLYRVHRVIWLMVHGKWPHQVDHCNRVRTDNRLVNLRETCDALNRQNVSVARKDSSTGVQGVSIDHRTGLFVAVIARNGRSFYLGAYSTADAARAAYVTAKEQLHPAWFTEPADSDAGLRENHLLNLNGLRRVRSDSSSGIAGVSARGNRWVAKFKQKYLGMFDSAEKAKAAYLAARLQAQAAR